MSPRAAIAVACLLAAGCASERVVLLPGSDGKSGAVAVLAEDGSERGVIDKPYTSTSLGGGSVAPRPVSEQDVRKQYGGLLDGLPPAPRVFTLNFYENSTRVLPESQATLQELFDEVARRSGAEVQVTGHTDRVGTLQDNDRLSRERAAAVRGMLIERGLDAALVRAVGRGEREPLVPTADEVGETRNRRVEITVR